MNAAVWRKAIADARAQLLVSCLLLLLFGWFFVWLQSLFRMGAVASFLGLLPDFVQDIVPVPLEQFATPRGRLTILYMHLVTLLICFGWAIARGSSAVSGGIADGTYELILTLPLRRVSVLIAVGSVATAGSFLLALSTWLGNCLGILTVTLEGGPVRARDFLPGAVNLFFMTFCFTGITAFFSAFDRNRWRTMCLAGGFLVVSLLLDMVASLWKPGAWLGYLSFLSAYDPPTLILEDGETWAGSIRLNGVLLVVGLVSYAIAGLVFSRRDIPVPR
jgi:ABC-type transport system involved in multi-copper enzyme maturation permease subunit